MSAPSSPLLSGSQLATLAQLGEERIADVGDVLFKVGDRRYPFIAIVEGEVAIVDAAGKEIIRHSASGFLGEMNLLTGQTVFVTAVVTQPLRYVAVDRDVLRPLLFDDGPLSDLLLSTFIARREALQRWTGVGMEIVGPRSSEATAQLVEFARGNRLPFTWRDPERADDPGRGRAGAGSTRRACRSFGCRAGSSCAAPTTGEVSRALGIGLELAPREEVDLVVVGGRPSRARRRRLRGIRGPRDARRRGHRARRAGGHVPADRELPRLPRGDQRHGADQPGSRAGAQVPRAHRDALPCRLAGARRRAPRRPPRGEREIAARAVLLATGAQYRRLPVDRLSEYEGVSVFYAAGPPEAQLCGASRVGVVGGGNSAGQAAVWLARGGALVTLLHRRADLRETMSELPRPRARSLRRRGS